MPAHDAQADAAGDGAGAAPSTADGAGARSSGPDSTIVLALLAHTNAGKTTLARTLLGRDIGEVRDAPHVTEFVEEHQLLRSADGASLVLADTPGFGDSVRLQRLLQRLQGEGNPVGWLLSQVWDRWRDRPFWGTQQALRHVRQRADVLLYLVNTSEAAEQQAAQLQAELALLQWLQRPVLVLLNQLGAPKPVAVEQGELQAWQQRLRALGTSGQGSALQVLPLDAFARCWVQEAVLWQAVQALLPADRQLAMAGLVQTWQQRQEEVFEQAMGVLAQGLARVACARVPLPAEAAWHERIGGGAHKALRGLTGQIGKTGQASEKGEKGEKGEKHQAALAAGERGAAEARAQAALHKALANELQRSTLELLRLHQLDAGAQQEIHTRIAAMGLVQHKLSEGRAALWGGMVSGALLGLKADIASGGLTLGGGLLVGGVLGALGAGGMARGLNRWRGTEQSFAQWPPEALSQLVQEAVLRYLAVAHFGRGRGAWVEGESPPHWPGLVAQHLHPLQPKLAALWAAPEHSSDELADALLPLLRQASRGCLHTLYPQAPYVGG